MWASFDTEYWAITSNDILLIPKQAKDLNIHINIYIYIHIHMYIHICIYIYTIFDTEYIAHSQTGKRPEHTYKYIYIYIYIHMYVHTYMYIYIYHFRHRIYCSLPNRQET